MATISVVPTELYALLANAVGMNDFVAQGFNPGKIGDIGGAHGFNPGKFGENWQRLLNKSP